MITVIGSFLILYLVPGYLWARFFRGESARSPFFYLLLSFLTVPLIYQILASLGRLSFFSFLVSIFLLAGLVFWRRRVRGGADRFDLDRILPAPTLGRLDFALAAIFFFLVLSPRFGLWQGYWPIGDDAHQVRKIVSVAESPQEPLFYHLPSTRLTIYYFNNVAPGLWVKFSQNRLRANQAWFLHLALQVALLLWLLLRIGGRLLGSGRANLVFFYLMTFFSGWEFFVYKLKGVGYVDQLEWWTDWFLPQSQLHLQITNPFNLFFWVPQHLMAALFLCLIYLITLGRRHLPPIVSGFLTAVLWANILGNSAFVFLSGVIVYGLWQFFLIGQGERLSAWFLRNGVSVLVGIFLAAKNLELFLTAEKGHYLVKMMNVFWFLPNPTLTGKIVNLFGTLPLYFLVEFGLLFLLLPLIWRRLIKDQSGFRENSFFYLYLLLLPVIFFVKALDDNNISLRAFIPAQIAFAFLAAPVLVALYQKQKRLGRTFFLVVFLGLTLPSALFDYVLRWRGQFNPPEKNDILYSELDRRLPLRSIVLAPVSFVDRVSALGHRFSLKDPNLFSATDREHSAQSRVACYQGFNFIEAENVWRFWQREKSELAGFRLYSLVPLNLGSALSSSAVFKTGGLDLYTVEIKEEDGVNVPCGVGQRIEL